MQRSFNFFILVLLGILSESKKTHKHKQKGGELYDGISLPDVSQPDLSTEIIDPFPQTSLNIDDTMDAITNPNQGTTTATLLFVFSFISFITLLGIIAYRTYKRISYN